MDELIEFISKENPKLAIEIKKELKKGKLEPLED